MATNPMDRRIAAGVAMDLARGPMVDASMSDPARAARVNQIARRLNLPPPIVDADLDGATLRARLEATRSRAEDSPTYARMMTRPNFARVAVDDDSIHPLAQAVDRMQRDASQAFRLGSTTALTPPPRRSFRGLVSRYGVQGAIGAGIVDVFRGAGAAAGQGIFGLGAALLESPANPARPYSQFVGAATGYDPLEDAARIAQAGGRALGEARQGQRIDYENWVANTATQGLESVPIQIAALVAAGRGQVNVALGLLSSMSGGQGYLEAREAGLSPLQSTTYGATQAGLEAAGELLPILRYVDDLARGSGFLRTLGGQLIAENIGEQFTGHLQDFNRWSQIDVNRGKTFEDFLSERPGAAAEIAIATTAAVGAQTSGARVLQRTVETIAERVEARAAQGNVDRVMRSAGTATTRTASPGEFEEALAAQLDGVPGENIYVPAEAVRSLFQSPEELSEDSFWSGYADQISEAEALGGDVVIPLASAATHLAGTPQWETLKDQVRGTAGGQSRAEMAEWDAAEAAQQTGEQLAALFEEERARMEPQQKIYEGMRDKLLVAGFTPDAASHLATQFAQRQRVRSERLGQELTGTEGGNVEVRQILPERLATAVRKTDDLDLVIRSLKGGKEAKPSAPSLLEFITSRGGIADTGGDVAAMGGREWHRGKRGRRKLIRENLFSEENMPDALARAAWEKGYFPNAAERPSVNDLLDAIDRELRGEIIRPEERAEATDDVRMAAQELRQLLDQQGIDADAASADEIKAAVQRYQSERMAGRELDQSYMEGPRGRITFAEGGRYYIDLFEQRDLSTFIHEVGHLYLEELKADAGVAVDMDTDQARQLGEDWEVVKAWFAANGHPVAEDGTIPTDAHELWARGFERFAMEGKAPSSALRRAFEAFRSWLLTIYKVADNLKAPITPEIRDVMTRLLATDEEITAAMEEQEIKALFRTAEEAGMTEAEFAAYQTSTREARDEAYDALLYRTMATMRAQRTKEYRERETTVRSEAMERVDAQPVFQALKLFRTGKVGPDDEVRTVRLSRQWLIDTYGEDALDALPRTVPPIYGDKNAVDPDILAEQTGFASGDEMIRTLMGHEQVRKELRDRGDKRSPRQVQIDEAVAAEMAERYGDPLRDGSIEEEARALIHNDRQGEVIASEIRALGRLGKVEPGEGPRPLRPNRRPTPYSIARDWAKGKIASGEVREVASGAAIQQYQRSARKAAKAAEDAMLKGDVDETYRQKQAQMLNTALISEAKKAKDQIDVAVRRLGKVARKKTTPTIDQEYLEQAQQLLEQVEFRPRSQQSLARQRSFEAWAAEQRADGHDVVTPEGFAASLGTTHWSKLTVEQLIGLDDTVKQILHLGRLKQTLLDGQERRAREEVIAEMQAAGGNLRQKPPSALNDPERSLLGAAKSRLLGFDAALIKIEQLVDWLDGGNPNGVFNRVIFRPLAEAQGREADMLRSYVEKVNTAIDAMPKKQLRDWRRRVDTPELFINIPDHPMRGEPWSFYKDQVVMIAFNWGNAGNRQRLLDGYGWKESQVQSVLDRLMTPEDWQFVQSIWDTVDELWPDIEALERRVNGVAPDRVEAIPIETPYGNFRGGYFPAVYDPQWSSRAESDQDTNLLERGYTRANTAASATKARADKVKRPMLLSMEVITRHLGEVIHDISHREALTEVWRTVSDDRVQRTITNTLGREYAQLLKPWLKHIANDQARNANSNGTVVSIFRGLRMRVSIVGLGYRFVSSIAQIAGMPNIIGQIGSVRMAEGWARFLGSFRVSGSGVRNLAYEEVTAKSAELRDRFSTMDRDIVERAQQRSRQQGIKAITAPNWFTRYAFHGILIMDALLTTAGWIGAYRKAHAEGMTEDDAIFYADKVVRKSQGAGGAKDQAAFMRDHDAVKLFASFFSYFSALYNQQRDFAHRLRRVSNVGDAGRALRFGFWVVVMPPLVDALVRGDLPGGGDDDEEETVAGWASKKIFFGNLGSIPGVRDIGGAIDRDFGYRSTPVQGIGEMVVQGWNNIERSFDSDPSTEPSSRWLKQTLQLIGYTFGLPTGQVANTAQFAYDVYGGEVQPESMAEVYEGVTTGRIEADR